MTSQSVSIIANHQFQLHFPFFLIHFHLNHSPVQKYKTETQERPTGKSPPFTSSLSPQTHSPFQSRIILVQSRNIPIRRTPPQHHNTTPSCKQNTKQKTRITTPPLQSNTALDQNLHSNLIFSNQSHPIKPKRKNKEERPPAGWSFEQRNVFTSTVLSTSGNGVVAAVPLAVV